MIEPIRIGVVGATGRMGQQILDVCFEDTVAAVEGVVGSPSSAGTVIGPQEVSVTDDVTDFIADCDVVIDFSTPDGFDSALTACRAHGVALVSGTTGLTEEQMTSLDAASGELAVLWAANFSVGVNVLEHLVELASRATDGFDIEVFEAHHRNKVDAPSGTAIYLGEAAARGRDADLDDVATWKRHGHTGARTDDEIGFQVVRGGSIVGEHTVFYCGEGERIELTHRALDRAIFARGAVRAAKWLSERPAGRYSMKDVLF